MAASESGVQLIARLEKKLSLEGKLEPTLFPNGPQHKNIIELYGEEGTGKTQMLLHLIAKCILPAKWNEVTIGGLGISVIFIDTDYHLSLIRLATLLEAFITECMKANVDQTREPLSSEEVESLVKCCLKQLFIVKCKSSSQFFITLNYLENLLCNKPDIGVMMVDSISAFYWIDKCAGGDSIQAQEVNMKRIASILEKLVNTYNLVVFATKSVVYQRRGRKDKDDEGKSDGQSSKPFPKCSLEHCEYLTKAWSRLVSQRLMFIKETVSSTHGHGKQQRFVVWFDIGGNKAKKSFIIQESGVTFLS